MTKDARIFFYSLDCLYTFIGWTIFSIIRIFYMHIWVYFDGGGYTWKIQFIACKHHHSHHR